MSEKTGRTGATQYERTTAAAVAGAKTAGSTEAMTVGSADVGNAMDVVGPKGIETMFTKMSPEEFDRLVNGSGQDMEFAPQARSMEEGDVVVGVLEGYGNGTEFTQKNQATNQEETRFVNTWILADDHGRRISILSSYRLEGDLPPFIGSRVFIRRNKDIKTSRGFRVANYTVAGPKRADGQLRSWARKTPPKVLDVPVELRQIEAGSADDGQGEDRVA